MPPRASRPAPGPACGRPAKARDEAQERSRRLTPADTKQFEHPHTRRMRDNWPFVTESGYKEERRGRTGVSRRNRSPQSTGVQG
jgi:hypothetical protein